MWVRLLWSKDEDRGPWHFPNGGGLHRSSFVRCGETVSHGPLLNPTAIIGVANAANHLEEKRG